MIDLFANAAAVKPVKSAAKKSAKDEIQMPGLRTVAMIDGVMKALSTLQASLTKEIKDTAAVIFHEQVCGSNKAPVSFRGVDGDASGSIECRKRGTNSPLKDDEVELLEKAGLKVEEQVIVPEMFGFNSAHIADPAVMKLISAALTPLMTSGKLPKDLIVKQEQVSKKVVTDATLEAACKLKDLAPEVLSTLTTLAIKPKQESTDIVAALAEITAMLAPSDAEVVVGADVIKG